MVKVYSNFCDLFCEDKKYYLVRGRDSIFYISFLSFSTDSKTKVTKTQTVEQELCLNKTCTDFHKFFLDFTDKNAQKPYKLRNPLAKPLVCNLLR